MEPVLLECPILILIYRLQTRPKKHQITWHWVKAHNGHSFNERADELANEGIKNFGVTSRLFRKPDQVAHLFFNYSYFIMLSNILPSF